MKLYDDFSVDQLRRHLNAFEDGYSLKVLLALSVNKVGEQVKNEVTKTLQEDKYKNIKLFLVIFLIMK